MRTAVYQRAIAAAIIAMFGSSLIAQQPSNWVAKIKPCEQSGELTKYDRLELGVWLNTANPSLAVEFRRALDFWSQILDMRWHERDSQKCSIQVVDGTTSLFHSDLIAARSQLVDRQFFRGWIAFNPRCRLSELDAYVTAVHELGHMFGLQHNPNPKSVMYFFNPDAPPFLDGLDLAALSRRHRLRSSGFAIAESSHGITAVEKATTMTSSPVSR